MPSTPSTVRPRLAGLLAVAAIGVASLGLGACGSASKPSTAAINSKLSQESELKQVPAAEVTCLAGVIQKYGSASSLNDYVNGKITIDKVKGSNTSGAKKAAQACAKG